MNKEEHSKRVKEGLEKSRGKCPKCRKKQLNKKGIVKYCSCGYKLHLSKNRNYTPKIKKPNE